MPYSSRADLPATIQEVLPEPAQERYVEIYNETWDEMEALGKDEQMCANTAHQQAWKTVEEEYVKVEEGDGTTWYRRGEEPSQAEIEASQPQGILDRLKSLF